MTTLRPSFLPLTWLLCPNPFDMSTAVLGKKFNLLKPYLVTSTKIHWFLGLFESWTMFSHPTRGSFFLNHLVCHIDFPLVSYRSIFTIITLAIMTYLTPSNYFLFTPLDWIQALICTNRFVFLFFFSFRHLFSPGANFSQSWIYLFFLLNLLL